MARRILLLNGHPDPSPGRFCAALCDAYAAGAVSAGHAIRRLDVGLLDFPLIHTAAEFEQAVSNEEIASAQQAVQWADHLVLVHPLWLGSAPAVLKGFLEQVFRYGFALPAPGDGVPRGLLSGRSARVVVTMGMPAPIVQIAFGAAGAKALERGILTLCGFKPVRHDYIGSMGALSPERCAAHLARMKAWGAAGS